MDNLSPDFEQTVTYEEDILEDDNFSEEPEQKKKKKKKRFKMECFSCNRPEYHSVKAKNRLLYSYVLGLTFGLSVFIGPFTCVCCGSSRLMNRNWLNPRFWFRKYWLERKKTKRRSSSSSKR